MHRASAERSRGCVTAPDRARRPLGVKASGCRSRPLGVRLGFWFPARSATGPIRTRLPMAKSEEPGEPGQGKLPEGLEDPLKMPATSPSSTPGRAGSPWARRLTIAGLFLLVLLLLAIGLAWVWVRHLLRKPAQAIRHDPGFGSAREDPDRPRRAGNPHDPGGAPR